VTIKILIRFGSTDRECEYEVYTNNVRELTHGRIYTMYRDSRHQHSQKLISNHSFAWLPTDFCIIDIMFADVW